jgi:hypothetical protein
VSRLINSENKASDCIALSDLGSPRVGPSSGSPDMTVANTQFDKVVVADATIMPPSYHQRLQQS